MSAVTFDTFKSGQKLKKAGFSEEQAEALTQIQQQVLDESVQSLLATKGDIHDIKIDILRIESKMDKNEFLLKTFGGGIFATLLGILLKLNFFG